MDYELYHHGILGMKWGVRRFQNPDGSLTAAGKKRYTSMANKMDKTYHKAEKHAANARKYIQKEMKLRSKVYWTDFHYAAERKIERKEAKSLKKYSKAIAQYKKMGRDFINEAGSKTLQEIAPHIYQRDIERYLAQQKLDRELFMHLNKNTD